MTPEARKTALDRVNFCLTEVGDAISKYEARISALQGSAAPEKAAKAPTSVKARSKGAAVDKAPAPPPPGASAPLPPSGDVPAHLAARAGVGMATALLNDLQKGSKSKELSLEIKSEVKKDGTLKINNLLKLKI